MVLQYYLLESDDNPGTGAESDTRDLPREGNIKALIFDVTMQVQGTATSARLDTASQIDQIQIGAVESNEVSAIDGEDLDAYNVLRGNMVPIDAQVTTNARVVIGFTYPLDPHMIGDNQDFSKPFGISGAVARRVSFDYAADINTDGGPTLDDKRMAIGVIVNTSQPTGGYQVFHRKAFTGATGGIFDFTDVPQPGKLLGTFNFETTNFGEITGDGDHRTTQSIRDQSITINRKVQLGPVYTTMMGMINGNYETGAIPDEGYSLWNLGITNSSGNLGVPTQGGIPDNMEIRTSTGAANAIRVHALILNTNT